MKQVESAVFRFCKSRMNSNPLFLADEMRSHLTMFGGGHSALSVSRAFGRLRKSGKINVECLNDRRSFYRITGIEGA
jgi:hypothetical protein